MVFLVAVRTVSERNLFIPIHNEKKYHTELFITAFFLNFKCPPDYYCHVEF